jgi:hypothetical protein
VARWLGATHTLKEARLQNPVLTNRNGIRGITDRVSKHTIAKPKEYPKVCYVDAAGIGGRKMLLPGEVLVYLYTGKSAEVIVVVEYELRIETAEDSQNSEGLNVKLFQIRRGSALSRSPVLSGTG